MFRRRKTKVPSSGNRNTIIQSKPEVESSSPTSVAAAPSNTSSRLPIVITVNEEGDVTSSSSQPRRLFATTNDDWSACSSSAYTDPRGGGTHGSTTSMSRSSLPTTAATQDNVDDDFGNDDEDYYDDNYEDEEEDANFSRTSRASSLNSFDIRLLEIAARLSKNFAAVADKLSFVETILDKLQCKADNEGGEGNTIWRVPVCTASTSHVLDDDDDDEAFNIQETAQMQRIQVVSAAATRFAKAAELANSLKDQYTQSASPAVQHKLVRCSKSSSSSSRNEEQNPTVEAAIIYDNEDLIRRRSELVKRYVEHKGLNEEKYIVC